MFIKEEGSRRRMTQMNQHQQKQAIAIADSIGRLIPQEGVDYDAEITFGGTRSTSVSLGIVAHTDKGEWWKKYVLEMIGKYPPTAQNPEPSINENNKDSNA